MYDQYCKFQLIKYRPWITTPSNSCDNNENFVATYTSYLQTEEANHYIPKFSQELDQAQRYVAEEKEQSEGSEDESSNEHDDWMLCCHLNQHYMVECSPTSSAIDWSAFARSLPPDIIRECPSWIAQPQWKIPTHHGIVSYRQWIFQHLPLSRILLIPSFSTTTINSAKITTLYYST